MYKVVSVKHTKYSCIKYESSTHLHYDIIFPTTETDTQDLSYAKFSTCHFKHITRQKITSSYIFILQIRLGSLFSKGNNW